MVQILLVISKFHPEYTGAAHRLDQMYRRLQKDDPTLKIDVLCNSTAYMHSEAYEHNGWNVKRSVFPFKLLWLHTRLKNAVKVYYEFFATMLQLVKHKPHIIHIAGYSGGTMAALLYSKWKHIPRIIELVTKDASPAQFLPGLRYQKSLALKKQSIIVAISEKIANNCYKIGLQKNIWSRPNPIDEKLFLLDPDKKDEYRKTLSPFDKRDIVIAMVAKFMPQKNQIFLLDTLKELPENFKLLLAGPKVTSGIHFERDAAYFEKLTERIKSLGLEDRVHIHADFVDSSTYMKAADLYVMPQYSEGLGTPMLEAIACGLPVIANQNEPAFCEWIEEGENGFLRPLDPQKWAEAIVTATNINISKRQKASKHVLNLANTQ